MDVTRESGLPAEPLWAVMSDVRSWPQWLDTINELTPLEPGRPEEVGAAYLVNQTGLPQARWIITDWRPGRGFTWETKAFGVVTTSTRQLEPVEGGTRIRLTLSWSGSLAKPVEWALRKITGEFIEHEALELEIRAGELRDAGEKDERVD